MAFTLWICGYCMFGPTPYRLYSNIGPLLDTSTAIVGHVLLANYFQLYGPLLTLTEVTCHHFVRGKRTLRSSYPCFDVDIPMGDRG